VVEVPHVITGEPTFLQLDCYPQTDVDDGPASHALILVTDITATLQSRQEIEQAHAHQAALATQLEQSVHDLERANADLVDGNAALQQSNAALEGARRAAEEVAGRQARQMEHLVESNRLLLAANEELTRRNAALRATRDAFLLSGEGAQAAIEEVATLNEEMQATNEELETLNEELQATIEELNMSNADLAARGAELQGLAAALQAQHQRSEREREQLAAILANMADAVLVVTPLGTPLLTNTAYMELFGSGDVVLRDEMGRPLSSAATPQMRAAQGETFSMTFICTTADGNRHWYEAIGQPVRGQGGLAWGVVVIHDITERSLRHLQEEFLALANHELRGPLAVIQGYLDLLASDLTDGAEGERLLRYASAARAQAKRLTRLVNDLRDVTRLERGKFSLRFAPVCLDTLLREAVEKGQTLPCDQTIMLSADRQVMVNGDAERLQQAVLNLLSNAVAHAAGSERIDVRLRCVDDVAEMEVQDYGAGITAEHLPDLFSRFYQVSHDQPVTRPGLGLELYIAQQIVAGHGGTITVASTEGEGTSFTVRLPLSVE
jgi:two-component system CheB/CheR fusion protein